MDYLAAMEDLLVENQLQAAQVSASMKVPSKHFGIDQQCSV